LTEERYKKGMLYKVQKVLHILMNYGETG